MPRGKPTRPQTSSPKAEPESGVPAATPAPFWRKIPPRCNSLDGRRWIRNSISVWSDLRKSTEELRLKHPASFPVPLVERLIESFLPDGFHRILDPFAGTGSTLVAARNLGKESIGLELSPTFCEIARRRLNGDHSTEEPEQPVMTSENSASLPSPAVPSETSPNWSLHEASAIQLAEFVGPGSIDLCVTSPPYWNILTEERSADRKAVRHYGNCGLDLGTIADYDEFLNALKEVFSSVLSALKPGAHCCVVVMDLRKKNRFYPFHSDLAARLVDAGFILDDIIIWNRQAEYNNLRPLGYPAVFRINKVHEFILLMRKPR